MDIWVNSIFMPSNKDYESALTISGVISGGCTLWKEGLGGATLTAVNTYTGTQTWIKNGTLADANTSGAIPNNSLVALGYGTNSGLLMLDNSTGASVNS